METSTIEIDVKSNIINLETFKDFNLVPVLKNSVLPNWYKRKDRNTPSVKNCPGIFLYFNNAISIPAPCDYFFEKTRNGWHTESYINPIGQVAKNAFDEFSPFLIKKGYHPEIFKVSLPYTFSLTEKDHYINLYMTNDFYSESSHDFLVLPGNQMIGDKPILDVSPFFMVIKNNVNKLTINVGDILFDLVINKQFDKNLKINYINISDNNLITRPDSPSSKHNIKLYYNFFKNKKFFSV